MRLVFWNCNMALHRKLDALLALKPDIAVVSECACPEVLVSRGAEALASSSKLWMGDNRNKGLGIFAFNGFQAAAIEPTYPTLRYILPARITGPCAFNLLAVWAQNASAGITRKHQSGPFRRALTKYRDFIVPGPCIIGGDFNNNAIWDRPGWRINHMKKVQLLAKMGIVSAYHDLRSEEHGKELTPTHFWRDRRRDGPTYHIDYIFVPKDWLNRVKHFSIGTFDDWVGNGLSDHVPVVLEI